jgi:hypothetical protein
MSIQMITDAPDYDQSLVRAMTMWRNGLVSFPKSYIDYHEQYARAELEAISKFYDFKVIATEMATDGWMDGMRLLEAVIETPRGKLQKLTWHDSHSNGHFMLKGQDCGGSGLLTEADLK